MAGKAFRPMGEDFQEAVMAVKRACPHRNDRQDAVALRSAAMAMAGLRTAPTFQQVTLAAAWARMRPEDESQDIFSDAATKDAAARMILAYDPGRDDNVKAVRERTGIHGAVGAMVELVSCDPNRVVSDAAREIRLAQGKDELEEAIVSAVRRRVTYGTLFDDTERMSAEASPDLSYMKTVEKAWASRFADDMVEALRDADRRLVAAIGEAAVADDAIGKWLADGAKGDFAAFDTFNGLEKLRREIDAIQRCVQESHGAGREAVFDTCREIGETVERLQMTLKNHASREMAVSLVTSLREQYDNGIDSLGTVDRMIKCETAISDLGAISRSFGRKGDDISRAIAEEADEVSGRFFDALKDTIDGALQDGKRLSTLAGIVGKASASMKPVLETFHPVAASDRNKAHAQPSVQVLMPVAEMLRKRMGCVSYSRETVTTAADEAKAILDAYKGYCSSVGAAGPVYSAAKEIYLAMESDERVRVVTAVRKKMVDPTLKIAKGQKQTVASKLADVCRNFSQKDASRNTAAKTMEMCA